MIDLDQSASPRQCCAALPRQCPPDASCSRRDRTAGRAATDGTTRDQRCVAHRLSRAINCQARWWRSPNTKTHSSTMWAVQHGQQDVEHASTVVLRKEESHHSENVAEPLVGHLQQSDDTARERLLELRQQSRDVATAVGRRNVRADASKRQEGRALGALAVGGVLQCYSAVRPTPHCHSPSRQYHETLMP